MTLREQFEKIYNDYYDEYIGPAEEAWHFSYSRDNPNARNITGEDVTKAFLIWEGHGYMARHLQQQFCKLNNFDPHPGKLFGNGRSICDPKYKEISYLEQDFFKRAERAFSGKVSLDVAYQSLNYVEEE